LNTIIIIITDRYSNYLAVTVTTIKCGIGTHVISYTMYLSKEAQCNISFKAAGSKTENLLPKHACT